jgi:plasmid stabilization system protein ParE
MRLRWTTLAADDLYNIVRHIQQDNPVAATDVALTLYDGCDNLRKFPYLGRKGRIAGQRELVFSGLHPQPSQISGFTPSDLAGSSHKQELACFPIPNSDLQCNLPGNAQHRILEPGYSSHTYQETGWRRQKPTPS